jgi:hypothetical protein
MFLFKTKEAWKWKGKIQIIKKDIITGNIKTNKVIKNRLMNTALNEILYSLYSVTNMKLMHVAIGDDNTANSDSLTTLYNEIYRVPIITHLVAGTGILQSRSILLDYEPVYLSGACDIKEIGFFGGSTSQDWNNGTGKDTGKMIARLIVSPTESKSDTEQINFVRTDNMSRG